MWVCGQEFSTEIVTRITATVEAEPAISRRQLARQVATWLGWRSATGRLQETSCRKALGELAREGVVRLPPVRQEYGFHRRRSRLASVCSAAFCGRLEDLGAVEVIPVAPRDRKAAQVWRSLLERHHYLGAGQRCGAQIRYVIKSERYGWVGALEFSAATRRLQARDQWIGWSEAARCAHLHLVVCNSRFLIVPTVKVPNLASLVLSRALARLPHDWSERYGYRPVLVETFVDRRRFAGTCYRAANWQEVGRTRARRRAFPNGRCATGRKQVYLYALQPDCREVLSADPEVPLGCRPPPTAAESWSEHEFGAAELYDRRLKRRLACVAADFFAHPDGSIPEACHGVEAKTKAVYRFFANPQVDMPTLLRPHVEATLERLKPETVVLAVQDTTTLNYTGHAPDGAGPINTSKDRAVGLLLHDTLALTTAGTPLGLLNVQCWARDPAQIGKKYRRKSLPIEAKESFKWLVSYRAVAEVQRLCPGTRLISVGDREADIYELFREALSTPSGPDLLVRAERTRHRRVDDVPLWDIMERQPVAGAITVQVPPRGSRPAREAKVAIRFAPVVLTPPKDSGLAPVSVWAVYAREGGCVAGITPLEWMLLTTVQTASFEQARERVEWYTRRWGIEPYHRTLKTCCRIEDRQLEEVESLQACLAVDMVVAWRVYALTKQGRETPHALCTTFLSESEWKVLWLCTSKKPLPDRPPDLQTVVRAIGKLGGHLGRKRDGEPGPVTVARGLRRLADMEVGFSICEAWHAARDGPPP